MPIRLQGVLNTKSVANLPVPVPPLPTQKRIASILSAYDDLIENNTKRIKILEEMARALYREWFVHFRFPGHESVKLVDSPMGKIPEGWEVVMLGDAALLTMGQSPKSEFYNDHGDGLPFHQGVTNFRVHFPEDRKFSTAGTRLADPGDILFSVRAPVGRINVSTSKMVLGRGLAGIRSNRMSQASLLYQLKEIFKEEDSMGGGTIFKAVTKKDVQNIRLLVPAALERDAYGKFADDTFEAIKNLTFKNRILSQTRDLLLPKLISGEIDVDTLELLEVD